MPRLHDEDFNCDTLIVVVYGTKQLLVVAG